MSAMKFNDPFESFRKALQPGSRPEWLKGSSEQFWRNQDRALDSMEKLAKGWFERRHSGARAAQEAAAMMCSGNPLDALHGYQQWAIGAFGRLMADSVALQQYFSAAGAATVERASSPAEGSSASEPLAPSSAKTDNAAA